MVEATVVEAARGVASARLELAAEQQMRGQTEAARTSVLSLAPRCSAARQSPEPSYGVLSSVSQRPIMMLTLR